MKNRNTHEARCKECRKIYEREYYDQNKEQRYSLCKKWRENNRDRNKENALRFYYQHRTEPESRLNDTISGAIYRSLKRNAGTKNGQHWEDMCGFTIEELKKHLEKQFTEGMDWANYGKWHLDHVIPQSAFNFSSPDHQDFKRCWNLNNLQSLWAKDNLSKNNKLTEAFQPSLAL